VFSAFLLAMTVATPIYGKLADLWGRKRLLLYGLSLFLLGSVLSGLAPSMPILIGTRVIQGLGAGAVMPIVLTILGDVFTLQERAKVQGWFSAVWGTSSLVGPVVGGFLTDMLSWRWVFFVTLPFGLFALGVLAVWFHERVERDCPPSVDWQGAALLAIASTALLLALLGGSDFSGLDRCALLALAVASGAALLWWERRAADPVLPPDLLARRAVAAAIAGNFLIGAILFGIETFLPLYVQGVQGGSARDSGWRLMPLLLTWSVSVTIAAPAALRFGFRRAAFVGALVVTSGAACLVQGASSPASTTIAFLAAMVVMGLGMGPTSLSYILAVQNSVPWHRRGVATGALSYFRTIGGSLGVAVLGAALSWDLAGKLHRHIDIAAALRPETHARLSPQVLLQVRDSLRDSLRGVFACIAALAALGLICALNLPKATGSSDQKGDTETKTALRE
jgi:EmrB/QacA subfamily drug resistance transporter